MEENIEEYYTWREVSANIKTFLLYLKSNWFLLLLSAALGAGLGTGYYFLQKPKYQAICTFILEEKQGGLGGLGSIASQFGIDVGGIGSSSLFAGDNILDILKSSAIVKKALLTKADSLTGPNSPTLADVYMDFSELNKIDGLKDISFKDKKNENLTLKEDSVLLMIQDDLIKKKILVERTSRKGTIISVSVTSPSQYFSKLLAERLVFEARNLYINIKSGTAQTNVKRLEQKADSILRQLNSKTYQAARAFEVDANPALRALSVPSEISSRDKSVLGAVYLEVVKNLEVSKTILNQQTPVIQLLDVPQLPIKNKAKSLFLLLFVFSFLAVCLFSGYLLLKFSSQVK